MTVADILAVPRGVTRIVHLGGRIEDVLGNPSRDDLRALLAEDELDLIQVTCPATGEPLPVWAAHASVPLYCQQAAEDCLREYLQRSGA